MLKVSYTKILTSTCFDNCALSEYRTHKLEKMRRDDTKRQGIAADLLLQKSLGFMPEIVQDFAGKPYLLNSEYNFNLSHSGNFAACAVSDTPVGIDIQKRGVYNHSVAARCFSVDELEYLNNSKNKETAFLEIWCKKESFLKASGFGITINLNSFSVFKDAGKFKFCTLSDDAFFLCVCREINAEPDDISYIDLP